MDLMEWVMVVAILDGPVVGLLYILWRKLNNEKV
jgi:hypothetical protein